ncbi:TonB-dependent receptor [Chryseobacterium sp.]|uniref:TonB-dependent receptor domain-containing protein n=1 Tax=Chryseobacterium sp. TaxID=1871047 RepID=UPI0025BC7F97|nr:TonB-dependent receptor [Chryseobacterium sp.]MBV8327289.1 TonB-dependent receptor [Chryseobacterium sp.]
MNKTKLLLFPPLIISSMAAAQTSSVTVSGKVTHKDKTPLPYASIILKKEKDSSFTAGTISNEEGRFSLSAIKPDQYFMETSVTGYRTQKQQIFIGSLSEFLEIPNIEMIPVETTETKIEGITLTASRKNEIDNKLDKKTYSVADNISQSGGSVLQTMQNLPGVTLQDNKVQLRGSDKITILIDGRQTALTGFGSQTGLDNIPSSAIDKIEIINNPSSKYDANGNAGIINIIMKKNKQNGWNGKAGFTTGLGSLWVRKENLPGIRPQYTLTPKINPSLSLNYRKNKINIFLQADNLYTQTLNKNEFVTRTYDDGTIINSQLKRNRNTNFLTTKAGIDWNIDSQNTLTISGMYGSEKIIDRGDQPFFNGDLSQRLRLWQFLEDELKTTVMGTASYQHKFKEAGHLLNLGFNYTFHREDEKYFYDNYLPVSTGTDAFKLLSDEQVYDFNVDYIKPLKYGRIETGIKLRNRSIPTHMNFIPGAHSVLDVSAGGKADYKEFIPAVYGNYTFENEKWEAELGLRLEYVRIQYDVNPNHPTYKSDGYNYTQPFPNFRLAYKLNDHSKFSVFYNRRVDRPNEVDIRIFPKYDDAEIIKVGNPALRPQFTNSIEMGYKYNWDNGYLYSALYHRFANGTITRISSTVPGSTLIYAIFQNAGRSYNTGMEAIWNQKISDVYSFNMNGNIYRNQIDAFSVQNLYPVPNTFSAGQQSAISGNLKMNNTFHFPKGLNAQFTIVYMAPDIIPQGKIKSRFSMDVGFKKAIQKGKGELFLNASDLLNTMVIKKSVQGMGFAYTSNDYYETQVVRLGYTYKF